MKTTRRETRVEGWVRERLRWEDWETPGRETVAFAAKEIRRRKWRGSHGGVVPGGYDAQGIAAEAIAEMLSGNGRVALGWVRSRLKKELERLVSQKIRVLHRRREATALRSEWEVLPTGDGGERTSVFEELPEEGKGGDEAAGEREERMKKEVEDFLGGRAELMAVFGCLCAGVRGTGEIARRLGMEEEAVMKARRALRRRLARFSARRREAI